MDQKSTSADTHPNQFDAASVIVGLEWIPVDFPQRQSVNLRLPYPGPRISGQNASGDVPVIVVVEVGVEVGVEVDVGVVVEEAGLQVDLSAAVAGTLGRERYWWSVSSGVCYLGGHDIRSIQHYCTVESRWRCWIQHYPTGLLVLIHHESLRLFRRWYLRLLPGLGEKALP